MPAKNAESLQFIRIFDPSHIPEYLVDQIKDKDFTTERFYVYQREVCTLKEEGSLVLNPYNLLFVLVDEDKVVQGFVWAVVDLLNGALCINNFSLNRFYWGKGKAVKILKDWALKIKEGAKLNRIYWISKNSKYCEKYGFEKSKHILFEYVDAKENENGQNTDGSSCKTNRRDQPPLTGTAELSEFEPGWDESGDGAECLSGSSTAI